MPGGNPMGYVQGVGAARGPQNNPMRGHFANQLGAGGGLASALHAARAAEEGRRQEGLLGLLALLGLAGAGGQGGAGGGGGGGATAKSGGTKAPAASGGSSGGGNTAKIFPALAAGATGAAGAAGAGTGALAFLNSPLGLASISGGAQLAGGLLGGDDGGEEMAKRQLRQEGQQALFDQVRGLGDRLALRNQEMRSFLGSLR